MHTPRRAGQVLRNGILGSLAPAVFEHIRPFLQPVAMKERTVLQEANRPVEHVHFIETGLVSLMTLAAREILETAMVGSEGFDPASVALGVRPAMHRSMVLIGGNALRIRSDDLQHLMFKLPELRERLLRYVHFLMIQCSQTTICGVQHQLEQRLAGWLCRVCDALDENSFPITHDHLSNVLGFHRPTVTDSLNKLEKQGLIRKLRGVVQICDRELLEQKACCCYGVLSSAAKSAKLSGFSSPEQSADTRIISRVR